MPRIRIVLVVLALFGLSLLLGAGVYDSVVLAPNLAGGAQVLEHGRQFMSRATPGTFYRHVAPLAALGLVLAMVACWPARASRWLLLAGFLLLVVTDTITFTYHYPRNHLLLHDPLATDPGVLARAAREWAWGNLARVFLVFLAWLGAVTAFWRLGPGAPRREA